MVIKKQKAKKFSILLIAAVSFLSFFSILLPAPNLSAQQSAEGGALAYMAKNCTKMKKTGDSNDSLWRRCELLQNSLKDKLGCSGTMFYSAEKGTDPNDPSIKETLWYTNPQKYTECVEKAQAKLNFIKSDANCGSMRREGGDSPGWKACENAQNALKPMNCSGTMFKERPDREGYWTQKPETLTDCQGQINTAKNASITDPDGRQAPAATSPPPAGAGGGAGTPEPPAQPDCDATKGVPLSWIICPVIDAGVGLTDYAFNKLIRPLLEDIPVSINPDDPSFKAWSSFRILGNVLLVGSLLMVVYSQARGPK